MTKLTITLPPWAMAKLEIYMGLVALKNTKSDTPQIRRQRLEALESLAGILVAAVEIAYEQEAAQ